MDGFEELSNQLNRMAKGAKELEGTHETSFAELFTDSLIIHGLETRYFSDGRKAPLKHHRCFFFAFSFVQANSKFHSMDEFWQSVGINSTEDFDNIPDEKLNAFVSSNTTFSTFQEMLDEATNAYISRKLGF